MSFWDQAWPGYKLSPKLQAVFLLSQAQSHSGAFWLIQSPICIKSFKSASVVTYTLEKTTIEHFDLTRTLIAWSEKLLGCFSKQRVGPSEAQSKVNYCYCVPDLMDQSIQRRHFPVHGHKWTVQISQSSLHACINVSYIHYSGSPPYFRQWTTTKSEHYINIYLWLSKLSTIQQF